MNDLNTVILLVHTPIVEYTVGRTILGHELMRRHNLNSISGRVIDDIHSQLKVLNAVVPYSYVITLILYELRDNSNKHVCPKSAQRHRCSLEEATHYPTPMVIF